MSRTSAAVPRSTAGMPRTRHLLLIAVLVFAWCSLWGEISVANIVSGLIVSGGLVYLGVRNRTGMDGVTSGRVQPGPLARLAALVAWDLAQSTVAVAREVLTPTDYTEEAIIAVDLPVEARHHLLLMVVAITVTPGTAVVDADLEHNLLYLHILHYDGRAEIERHVRQLARLAVEAFPAADDPNDGGGTDSEERS